MAGYFSWIHISDIHFRDSESFNTEELREKLLTYLKKYVGVNALIISGDFRFGPDKTNNSDEVVKYIYQCASELKVDDKKIFVVPGNHDLNRDPVRTAVVNEVKKKYNSIDGRIDSKLLDVLNFSFSYYNELNEKLGATGSSTSSNPHRLVDAGEVYFLLLNTDVVVDGNECNDLIIGTSLVREALKKCKESKPIIAVGHHGSELWKPEEQKTCFTMLDSKGVRLYLCGHSHSVDFSNPTKNISQVTLGCLTQPNDEVESSIAYGEITNDGNVKVKISTWNSKMQIWEERQAYTKDELSKYEIDKGLIERHAKDNLIQQEFRVTNYHLLGTWGSDGIKYFWKKGDKSVESIAFNKLTEEMPVTRSISGYTVSTSFGCQLHASGDQCRFCGTGTIDYKGPLTADEIALQCIFMAEYDSNCDSFRELKNYEREFAFMGQGEPGLNYSAIREAIILTDIAMKEIDQKVYRYVISTSGINSFMPSLISDINSNVFRNPVTVHFSLSINPEDRSVLMPINKTNSYIEFIELCKALYKVTHEKVGVSILLLNNCKIENESYTLTKEALTATLANLDRNMFRIDLYNLNNCGLTKQRAYSNEMAKEMQEAVLDMGFECRIKRTFGDSCGAGFGMLNSKDDDLETVGEKTINHFYKAAELLQVAKNKRRDEIEALLEELQSDNKSDNSK